MMLLPKRDEDQVTFVIQQFSNSLDLLVFRLKAKELIHTALYQPFAQINRIIAVTITSKIHGALPAKSPPRQLLKYSQRDYGFDVPWSFG